MAFVGGGLSRQAPVVLTPAIKPVSDLDRIKTEQGRTRVREC